MMKYVYLALALVFTLPLSAQWTWEDISPQYNQARPFHIGMHVPNDSTVWAIPFWLDQSINPQFAVTDDAGESWTVGAPELDDPQLMSVLVYALNADTAWIASQQMPNGTYGRVHVTYDRGATWSLVDIPGMGNRIPLAIHFYNAMEGVVVAQNFFTTSGYMRMYKTFDGGATWTDVSIPLQFGEVMWIYNGESIMERIGDKLFIGTGFGRVLRSVDRGSSWDVVGTGLGNKRGMHSVAFQDENTGIILSSYDLDSLNNASRNGITVAAKTTDGGETWTPIAIPPTAEHIEYVPNSGGVYVSGQGYGGWPKYHISYDGGESWKEKGSPNMINIVYTDQDVGYAGTFGFDNGIIRYTGPPLTYNDEPLPPSDWLGQGTGTLPYGNFVGNYINEIEILDEQTAWAISAPSQFNSGQAPHLLKTTDGGQNWSSQPIALATDFSGMDMHVFNAQKAFASLTNGDGEGALIKTEDGGNTWSLDYISAACGGYIHFFNDLEGLMIDDGTIEITQDGGATWLAPDNVPEIAPGDIPNVQFNGQHYDEAKGDQFWYVSIQNQKLFRTKDRGLNWESFPTPGFFNSIAMKDSLNGLAVEVGLYNTSLYLDSTTVFRTQDGGESWEVVATRSDDFTLRQIEYVEGSEASYVASSAYNASTSFSNDDGETWTFIDENFFADVVRFYDNQTGWCAKAWANEGYEPVIYKWNGDPFPELIVNTQEEPTPNILVHTFPNPCTEVLNVAIPTIWPGTIRHLQLLDATGKVVQQQTTGSAERQWQLDVSTLPGGKYFLEVQTETGRQVVAVVKQ
jgi:photosystem II stability/assembly factor-like uncharacterized protein